jgi:NAD(P)-dependent dehydrogenase (short-subunit alcohol dehydrogenase family)
VQAAVPHMPPGSSIINTGSVTALEGRDKLIDYSATKGALHTLTHALATALAPAGIRVNCVAPGPVWTPLIPASLEKKHVRRFGASTVWERPAQPIEIATSYVFIASADARFYTGEIFAPTGSTPSR